MASHVDVSTELANIASAIYGKDVRGSIHDGIQKIANAVNGAIDTQLLTVDGSLTQQGAGADAAIVGAMFSQIQDSIDAQVGIDRIAAISVGSDATEIASGTNLNSITAFGIYVSKSQAISASLINCPISDNSFVMYVERVAGATAAFIQRIIPYHPERCDEWTRIYSSTHGTWGEWIETGDAEGRAYGKYAKPVAVNTDLNDYTTPGVYVRDSADGYSIGHDPVNNMVEDTHYSYMLYVERIAPSKTAIRQRVVVYDITEPQEWIRFYTGSIWTKWIKTSSGYDLEIIENEIETLNNNINQKEEIIYIALGERPDHFWVETQLNKEKSARGKDVVQIKSDIEKEKYRAIAEEKRIESLFTSDVTNAVNKWINDNPDKMINLQDHSVGSNKISYAALNYVTPEMFGAVGDGITDDSQALESASEFGIVYCGKNNYYIENSINIKNSLIGGVFNFGLNATFILNSTDHIEFRNCIFKNKELPDSTSRGKWLLVLQSSYNVLFNHCKFTNCVSAVYIDRSKNIIFTNCTFSDIYQLGLDAGGNGYGILLVESKNILISNNFFIDVARHAIYVSHDSTSSYNENIKIINNMFIWSDSNVGATGGFETPINVRPCKNIRIDNNYFENTLNIATFVRQEITIDGERQVVSSENIYIENNSGDFKYTTKRYGIIFFSQSSTEYLYPSIKNIYIKNNNVSCAYGSFVCADAFEDLYIDNNNVTLSQAYTALVECKTKHMDMQKNLHITNNVINLYQGFIFNTNRFGDNIDRLDYGIFEFSNNRVTGLRCIGRFPTFPSGKKHHLTKYILMNNYIEFVYERDFWGSPVIDESYIKDNIVNNVHSLYIGNPTNVFYTDPVFLNSGTELKNMTMTGSIFKLNDDIYIKAVNDWVKLN